MSQTKAVGIRLEDMFLKRIERLSKEENLDRSTAMRILLEEGYKAHIKKKAAQDYLTRRISISKAAEKADITVWEMEQYLIDQGFRSEYSLEDLKEEMGLLKKK